MYTISFRLTQKLKILILYSKTYKERYEKRKSGGSVKVSGVSRASFDLWGFEKSQEEYNAAEVRRVTHKESISKHKLANNASMTGFKKLSLYNRSLHCAQFETSCSFLAKTGFFSEN